LQEPQALLRERQRQVVGIRPALDGGGARLRVLDSKGSQELIAVQRQLVAQGVRHDALRGADP
jgi:hypothetical protein